MTSECQKTKIKCLQDDDIHTWFCTQTKSKTKTSLTKTILSNEHLELPPVMVKTAFISTVSFHNNKCGKLGSMFDDFSTDHYVTHATAKRYNFPEQEMDLEVEGIAGIDHVIPTTIYTVTAFDLEGGRMNISVLVWIR